MPKHTVTISIIMCTFVITSSGLAQTNPPTATKLVSIKDALLMGPSPIKMHALSNITQGKVKEEIDASFLPGFSACADDNSPAVRSISASLLGKYYISENEAPLPEALQLLEKLATDESADVRYNALYNGLTNVSNKSDSLVEFLINAAAVNREEGLYDKIINSLADYKTPATKYLNSRLNSGSAIAFYEIYKDLTGEKPTGAEQYQDMPSSQPQLYVFTTGNPDKEAAADQLETWISSLGIKSYNIEVSGYAGQRVLLLTTYITRDNETVLEKLPLISDQFKFMQKFWLTPQLSSDIELVRKREIKQHPAQ